MAIYLSPQGPGFFLFFQRFRRESVKKEVIEFDLSISRIKNIDLNISRIKSHSLGIARMNES